VGLSKKPGAARKLGELLIAVLGRSTLVPTGCGHGFIYFGIFPAEPRPSNRDQGKQMRICVA
jgi:hypothetical protein